MKTYEISERMQALAELIRSITPPKEYSQIKDGETDVTQIAIIFHEANRAYCATLGDDSQLPWAEAPQWQRDSIIAGVEFRLANPDAGPDGSHNAWLAAKEADGWKYGPVKDAEKKEHPCFVPYDQLPEDQKRKDYLFIAICNAFLQVPK